MSDTNKTIIRLLITKMKIEREKVTNIRNEKGGIAT